MISDRLLQIRKQLRIKQKQMAKALSVTPGAVSKWQHGVNEPPQGIMKVICATYHVNYEWLSTGNGKMFSSSNDVLINKVDRVIRSADILKRGLIQFITEMPDDEFEKFFERITRLREEDNDA